MGALAEYALPKSAEPDADSTIVRAATVSGRLALLGASVLAVALGGVTGSPLTSGIGLAIGTVLLVILLRIEQRPRGFIPTASDRRLSPPERVGRGVSGHGSHGGHHDGVLYLPYVATEVGGYSPIVGGYLSAILSLSWTAAAFCS